MPQCHCLPDRLRQVPGCASHPLEPGWGGAGPNPSQSCVPYRRREPLLSTAVSLSVCLSLLLQAVTPSSDKLPPSLEGAPPRHASHPPLGMEMILCHAPPDPQSLPTASVAPLLLLLLLLLALAPPGHGCIFEHDPFSTTLTRDIEELTQLLLLDYPVSLPSNLEPDLWCYDFWVIHFMAAELRHMEQVAGRSLNPKIQAVARQILFLQDCNISDPLGCMRQGQANVSQLLGALSHHMGELEMRWQQEPWPVTMSNCTYVRCRTDTPDPTSETTLLSALTYSRQKQERTLVSRASPQTGGLVLLILVPTLFCLGFTLWQLQQRLWRQRTQVPEEMGT